VPRKATTPEQILPHYISSIRAELADRWRRWAASLTDPEKYTVVLLARQVTLASQMARSPRIWNAHIAPVILRTMVDTHLTLAWILRDPQPRARQFILYGLGQYKLFVEHVKVFLKEEGLSTAHVDAKVAHAVAWLESQRFPDITEVNVGTWSGLSAREMADEVGLIDFYNYTYTPFSAASHSMWHHIGRFNVQRCENPLHRFHQVPLDSDLPIDIDYMYRAAKFVDMSFKLFDSTMALKTSGPSSFEKLAHALARLSAQRPKRGVRRSRSRRGKRNRKSATD
jgi:hypothetical protein